MFPPDRVNPPLPPPPPPMFFFWLLHRPMHSRDGSDIARSEIELKKTIFMNDLEKSALLFIFVDGSLLLKWKFYEVLSNRADGSFLFSLWQVFPEPFS